MRRKRKSNRSERTECPHCRGGEETFRYMQRNYLFDVDKARVIVDDGREPIELDSDDIRFSVDISRIYPHHLPHVDTRFPGIIAHLWHQQPDGEIIHGHLLIDGHHRAARCLQLGLPYFAHILTEEESCEIMLQAPAVYEQIAYA